MLLNSGADVNVPGRDYGSALQAASAKGNVEIFQLLLDRGAEINAQGDRELEKGSGPGVKQNFKQHGDPLQAASAGGHYETVRLPIDSGAEFNAQNKDYGTALEAAQKNGQDRIF